MYSVIIPSYNRCFVLSQAIDSVLLQNEPALEIIVIDDGSNDNTAQMIAKKYPKVRYFYQENQGPAAAKNRGIRVAKGNIIAFLDSDDIWLADKITLEKHLFYNFSDADMLAGNATTFLLGKSHIADVFAQRQIDFYWQQPRFFDWTISIMERGPVCLTSSMTYKKSTLDKLGRKPFDESLRLDEDWDFEFRLFSQSKALLYPQIRCHRRIFNDDTRHFYSIPGQEKSPQEQLWINQQQQKIIARYLDNIAWHSVTQQRFQQRHQQLNQCLV